MKASLLYNMLEQLVGTLYRQPMFAQFEAWLHEQLEAGQALSSSDLTDYYYKLNQDYYGPAVTVHELENTSVILFLISITTSMFINTRSACPLPYPSLPGFSREKPKITCGS